MEIEEVREGRWGKNLKAFISEQLKFKVDAETDGEPVKLREDRGDITVFFRTSKEAGSCILYQLSAVNLDMVNSCVEGIALIQLRQWSMP